MFSEIIDFLSLKDEFTVGDAATFILALLIAVGSIAVFVWTIQRHKFPFKMKFSYQPPHDIKPKTLQRGFTALMGKRELYLKIDTKVGTEISGFDMRFVSGLLPFSKRNVSPDIAKITAISVYEWDVEAELERDYTGPNEPRYQFDAHGGIYVSLRKAKRWAVGDPLWITIGIDVTKPWKGYLSFRSRTDRRAVVYRKISLRENW